ncbi:acyl-CoA-binding domain-containing protein 6-like isoform X2 [Alnus glutinosa]|uniref:acyl-CoA-binding domain-containing protein 6-like isoform X2 n=1 Tax=Alnus glutinosa TaxID=3517 RepID=UPI002D79E271|nr:acyl-CoA-binding domain-containing protein 6-like isoform X2 [Alnus glutinosa]
MDSRNMRWERVQLHPKHSLGGAQQQQQQVGEISGPGKRWGHTCNAIKGGRFLYVFGGYGRDNCQTNQVHVFDTANQTWSQPLIKGIPPTPRDSHSCTTVGDNLFVFGGTDGMNPLKDLHILDTSSRTWISPSLRGDGPEAREGHTAALVGKRLFVFGGCGKSADNNDEIYYNDLYVLNTETFVWKRAATSGTPPSPRDSHTCSSWKNNIIVIGGEDAHDYYLSDVHVLDTDTLIWRELSTSGHLLAPRAGHATVAFGKNLFVFGGFTDAQNLYNDLYVLDVDTGAWTKVITTGDGPSARFSVAGDCLDPVKGGVLVFIGGCNKSLEALDDMYYLYTGLTREKEWRLDKLSLRKQLKLKCQEQNLTHANDKALVRIGGDAEICQPIFLPSYGQPGKQDFPWHQSQSLQGKKTFQAKVTENIPVGYTIETVIDGKPLRGILFSNKSNSYHIANYNLSRKRAAGEVGVISNGDCNSKSKTSRTYKQDVVNHGQVDGVHGKDSASHEPTKEAAAVPVLKNPASSDASQPPKVDVSPEQSVPPSLNLEDDQKNDAPSSNNEVPREDKTNDIPNCNTEVPKENTSAAANDTVTSFPSQDDRTAATSDPAK